MNCAVLTFQFARNYGAVLQVYALREFLQKQGHSVKIVNYMPARLESLYTMNPLRAGLSPRAVRRFLTDYPVRSSQYQKFLEFSEKNLGCTGEAFMEEIRIAELLKDVNAVIYGSDQIWNDEITGQTRVYYGDHVPSGVKRIAYAGSFGTKTLSPFQAECVGGFLPQFHAVSVREDHGRELIAQTCGLDAVTVCDPVFLLGKQHWESFISEMQPVVSGKYILLYALKSDPELEEKARKLSAAKNIPIYTIHPNGRTKVGCGTQLKGVGPLEFAWLIANAELVCTNSFHATAFSVLYEKRLLLTENIEQDARISSILRALEAYSLEQSDETCSGWLELARIDDSLVDKLAADSRRFLREAL